MIYTNNINYGGTSMRLWHQSLLPYLDNRRILGQHRECCALRGRGWGKRSSVINYIYDEGPESLVAYHIIVMHEMLRRGYHPNNLWCNVFYRGPILGMDENFVNVYKVNELYKDKRHNVFRYHNNDYLQQCLDNLHNKGVTISFKGDMYNGNEYQL